MITGFTAGAGILIFVNQLRHLLHLEIPSSPTLWDTLGNIWYALPQADPYSLILGLGTILVILLFKSINPRLPGPLIAIVLAAIITVAFDLTSEGVLVIGEIPRGLPPLVKLPLINVQLMGQMFTGALAIAAIGLIEAMSIARNIASTLVNAWTATRNSLDRDWLTLPALFSLATLVRVPSLVRQ